MGSYLVPRTPTQQYGRRGLIAFGVAAIAALTLIFGALVWMGYRTEIEEARGVAEKLARALDEHTRAVFETVDSVLRSTQGQLERAAARGETDPDRVRAILQRNVEGHRAIYSLTLDNAGGRVTQ